MAKCIQIFLVFLFLPSPLCPQHQNIKFEHIAVEDKSSNNTVNCIHQDSKGFIWIGTEDGLSRYDGYTFRRYAHDPENLASLSHNNIQVIYEDPTDSGKVLWIGTKGGGLNRFDLETERFERYLHVPNDPTGLSDSDVECIFKDNRGVYWIGTQGGGLSRFDRKSGKFVSYQHNPDDPTSLRRNNVSSICEDHVGNLWIATLGGGLNKLNLYNNEKDTVVSYSLSVATWTTHPVAEVWEYQTQDSSAQTWKKKSDMLTARCFSSSCTIDGRIYVVGGLGHRKPPVSPSVPNLEVYDPAKDSWERLADMKVARAGISVSVVDRKIYAIGGTFVNNSASSHGGGIYAEDSIKVINSIFWGNTPDQLSGYIAASYCDIQGGWTGTGTHK
jgi:predicted outer membrane repeat protein